MQTGEQETVTRDEASEKIKKQINFQNDLTEALNRGNLARKEFL